MNRFRYIIHFAVHLLVPEADYAIAVIGEISCSSRILVPLVGIVTAVELDNQPLLEQHKSAK